MYRGTKSSVPPNAIRQYTARPLAEWGFFEAGGPPVSASAHCLPCRRRERSSPAGAISYRRHGNRPPPQRQACRRRRRLRRRHRIPARHWNQMLRRAVCMVRSLKTAGRIPVKQWRSKKLWLCGIPTIPPRTDGESHSDVTGPCPLTRSPQSRWPVYSGRVAAAYGRNECRRMVVARSNCSWMGVERRSYRSRISVVTTDLEKCKII